MGSGNSFQEEWGRIVLKKADVEHMKEILETFLRQAQVPGAFLFSKNGYMVAEAGMSSSYGLDRLSDLSVEWFDSLRKDAGASGDARSLIQNPEEGQEHVLLRRVYRWAILAVVFEKIQDVDRLRQETLLVCDSLTKVFDEAERRTSASGHS